MDPLTQILKGHMRRKVILFLELIEGCTSKLVYLERSWNLKAELWNDYFSIQHIPTKTHMFYYFLLPKWY
jgi:hypothetical protein